jgi:acyl-CoA reductase-like NAD-dependent aldehyde dehydrogenase
MSLAEQLVHSHPITVVDAALGEILTTCEKMSWVMKNGEKVLKPYTRRSNLLLSYKNSKVYNEPLGVVSAIVSWNYRQSLRYILDVY